MTTIPPGVRTPLVKAYRPDLFPSNHLQPTEELSELFERILVVGHSDAYDEMTDQTSIELQLAADPEIAFELPGTGGLQVILGGTGSPVTIDAEFGPDTMTVGLEGSVRLQLPTQWLRPVVERDGQWVDDPTRNHVELDLSLGLELDQDWNVSLTTTNEFDIGPAMIGKTGFVVEGTIVADLSETADLDESAALGLDESWRGVVFTQATLYPPESLDVPLVPERIDLVDFHAGTGGVFGTVELTGVTTGELFGFPFELRTLELTFHQSVLTATDIRGRITVPFFDAPMDLELGVAADGTLHAGLSTEDGVKTITHEVCTATIDSVSFDTGGVPSIGIGGMVELNIPDVSLEPVRVDELRIDAEGNTSLQGGWLELPDQYSVDFHGFTFEVTAFGIGRDDDDRKWIGLNGAVSFVDELSAGASVDGLRISWEEDSDGPTDVGLSFDGIGVEFEVPDAVRFAGEVSYSEVTFQEDGREVTEHRFDGAVELDLLALDISIDATLAIGTREEGGREFTFFAVYLGTDLPRGIPLFSTGLALYGVAGLYAGNMRPSKDDEMAWYTADGPSWYHQSPEGVVDFKRKWAASEGSFALGAGVTLGTAADNGFTFSGRLLLVVAFPGPVVMLQGLANLLQERAALSGEEPNFSALAVLDGQAGTLSFGLDAQYRYGETGELADIAASVEAFYNLNDPTAWYIYLGRKEPRDRRVRASMYMGLFEANAYFMLDPRQLAIGAWYGFDESYSFGPLGVDLEAWISGDALVSFFPAHFSAELAAAGGVTLSAFGIRLGVELEAGIGAEVFDPFHLYGAVHVRLNVPWPFEDPTATVRLEWGPEKTPPPLPLPLKEVSVDHQLVTTSWPLPRGAAPDPDSATDPQETYPALLRPNLEADGIIADPDALLAGPADPDPEQEAAPPDRLPVVPLDGRPQVTFTRPVHDDGGVGFNPQPVVPKRETIGDPGANEGPADVRYALSDVRLERFDAATTDWVDVPDVYGAWAPMPALPEGIGITGADPSMANTKLWIRSRNPFDYVRHTGGSYTETVHRRYRDYPCGTATDCYAYDGLTTDDFDVAEEPLLEGQPIHATTARRRYDADWPVVAHLWFAWPPDDSVPFPRPADYRPRVVDHTYSTADGSVSRPVFEFQPVAEEAARNFAVGPRGLLHLFFVTLPEPRRSVRLSFVGAKGINAAMLMGTDDRGVQRRAGRLAVDPETETTLTITSPGGRFERVGLLIHGWSNAATTALGTVRLVETCVADADLEDLGRTEVDQVEHLREGLARWSDEAPVFAPWTTYRLVVETTVDAVGRGEFDWFERRGWLREYAYFRTEAPPGLGRLSTPIGTPDPDQHESGLEDLRPYVNATVPATRPPAGERPSLPRPVYRAYDVGVAFGRTYVDLLYRSVGHDLAVTLFDSNNRPARDAAGRLIIDANPWDVVESLTLDRDDGTWLRTVSRAGCVPVDESTVRHADRLQATVGVLAPDTVYEARLVPRLLREGFADEAYHIAGTTMSAPTAWQTVDEGFAGDWHVAGHPPLQGRQATVAGQVVTLGDAAGALDDVAAGVDSIRLRRTAHDPDAIRDGKTYEIAAVDATAGTVTVEGTPTLDGESAWSIPGRGHVRQSATPSGSTSDAPTSLHVVSATRGGTDPADWTDYRLETTVGIDATATDPDARAGVVVRYDAASGSHLRYELNRHTDRRQLQLVTSDGRVTLAAVDGFDATPAADYRIAVEVVGTDVRVYEDGAFVLDADLAGHGALASGSVGFLTACEATFGELRVDDVSTAAPTPYRFAFTTSRFANFGHQVGSYDDETWHVDASSSLPLGGGAGIRAASPDAQVSPDATEGRTYEAVVDALDRPRRGLPARIEVTRVAGMDGTPVGLLVESPEPIDWPRTTLSLNRTAASPPVVRPPTGVKLVAATLAGDQEVDVLLREATDLSGYEIEFRRDGTASGFAPALGDGFEEGFEDSLDDYRAPIGELDWWHVDEPDEDEDGDAELVLDTTVDGGTAPTDATLVRRGHTQSDGGWRATVAVGDGERVGLTFRYRSPTANYRFVVGPDGRALVRVDGGIGSTLWEHEAPVDAGDVVKLTVIAAEGHLRGSVDGVPAFTIVDPDPSVAGSVGIAVERATSARVVDLEAGREVAESVCLEERWGRALESTMWTPVDEPPDTTRESEWVVASGELQQRSNIYGFAGGEYRAPGTHIHPGTGESWTDYRVTLSLQSDDDDAIGLLFRRRDASNYYRFSMDRERGYRRLVKVVDGETTLLWADGWSFEAGREYLLSIACVGDRITGALDGEALFSVVDGTHAAGTVAPYCRANRAARFGTIRVVVSADNWIPLYRFEETESLPAGSVLRLHESTVASRTGAGIYSRRLGTGGMGPRMPTSAVELRVVGPDGPEHERSFNPATTYARVSDVSLLRSADGTGVFVHPAGGLDAGGYRLAFTYRRDADEGPTLTQAGDDGPEFGTVDVPWETVREADRSETDG